MDKSQKERARALSFLILIVAAVFFFKVFDFKEGAKNINLSEEITSKDAREKFILNQRININELTEKDFTLVPGIGKKTARRIIEKRQELGGSFSSADDLEKVKGISKKKVSLIKEFFKL